ncbi:SpaH/EbpB family LPXTG-anchored major pilin [Leucobacter weissii]|uniref:SpaH/EbpB family LPXTG-anchored major pilin n=1 Tax=Leucobacter weissii TaxID=1983706 RepID=A0A939MNA8_9MICO|nr:SpaH/EbpB family LPXTG-anchored major pilin [Leucobacter weissii]MBO1901717.1 SpaH/EbpB family LPXTG-anchored major pilin [Leucobacter weissii]
MNTHKKQRGLLVSLGALATAAALALGGAAAQAAPPNPPASTNVVITKVTNPGGTLAVGDGTQETVTGGLPGATFQLTLIANTAAGGSSSTLTNAGLLAAQGRSLDSGGALVGGTESTTALTLGPTGANGATASTSVPAGQYVVREIDVPAGQTKSAPFLLTLPLTNPDDGAEWLSTVYAYPKAANVTATKSVDEGTARVVGENIEWEILTDAPQFAQNQPLTGYVITDQLDSRLALVGDPAVRFVDNAIHAANPLVKDTDYTVAASGGLVTITFLSPGLAKLQSVGSATPTTKLSVKLTTAVSATVAPLTGAITNDAKVTINNENEIDTNDAEIVYGDLVLSKVGQSGSTKTPLNGAKFKLYRTAADATSGTGAISIDGVSEWTTQTVGGVDGRIVISGLLRSDFVDGGLTTTPADFRSFYLVETEAPAGHQLVPGPIEVQVVLEGGSPKVWEIADVETEGGFELPLTGGTGTLILTIGGIAILAIVLLVARRRRTAEASAE